MIYQSHLTLPANTLETAKIENILVLPMGVINKAEICFPSGCSGLAHVQVYFRETLLWPSSPDDSFAWDGDTISWAEDFSMTEAPYELLFRGWNEDELYQHIVTLRVAMLSGTNSLAAYMTKLIAPQISE
jgi:hypothetical protein